MDFYQNKNFSSKKLIQAGKNKISVGDRPKAIMPEAGPKKVIAVVECLCEIHWLTPWNENPDSQWPRGWPWQFRTGAIHLWHFPFLSIFLICEKTLIARPKTKQNNKKKCRKVCGWAYKWLNNNNTICWNRAEKLKWISDNIKPRKSSLAHTHTN